MRTKARKDANHNDIQKLFMAYGFAVLDISQLKHCCDLFVAKGGITFAIEIKDGSKKPSARKLTQGEELFRKYWKDKGLWRLVETEDDVKTIVKEQRGIASDSGWK